MSAIEALLAECKRVREAAEEHPEWVMPLWESQEEFISFAIENMGRLERLARIQAEELRKVEDVLRQIVAYAESDPCTGRMGTSWAVYGCAKKAAAGLAAVEERFARGD